MKKLASEIEFRSTLFESNMAAEIFTIRTRRQTRAVCVLKQFSEDLTLPKKESMKSSPSNRRIHT